MIGEDQSDLFGTEPHKLHRRDAVDTSVAAAHTVDTTTDEKRVYDLVLAAGETGTTLKELQPLMGKDRSAFSGRISALLRKGLIVDAGTRRDGCRVVRRADNAGG